MIALRRKFNNRCLSLLEKTFKYFDISAFFFTGTGVKCLNQLISSDQIFLRKTPLQERISLNELHLGCDGLNDSYTLLGRNLADSPHLELVEILMRGEDPVHSEYIFRESNALMHFRNGIPYTKERAKQLQDWFHHRLKTLQFSAPQIMLANVSGQYYILDGKHTAAICLFTKNENLVYWDVTPFLFDSFFFAVCQKMRKRPLSFKKHLAFFEALYKPQSRSLADVP
jgi:hypothetical protein